MNYFGQHAALMDDKGRMVFPKAFRRLWPSALIRATIDYSKDGSPYISCLGSTVNLAAYERACPPQKGFRQYHLTALDDQHRAQLGAVVRLADLRGTLVWVPSGPAIMNDLGDMVELWQKDRFDAHVESVVKECGIDLRRVFWVPPEA